MFTVLTQCCGHAKTVHVNGSLWTHDFRQAYEPLQA